MTPEPTLYTAPDMARVLGYHSSSIYRCIERERIAHSAETPSGIRLYGDDALAAVKSALSRQGDIAPGDA